MVLTKCSLIAGPIMAIINHWLTGTHNIILAAAHCLSQSWLSCSAQVRNFYNMQNMKTFSYIVTCLSQQTFDTLDTGTNCLHGELKGISDPNNTMQLWNVMSFFDLPFLLDLISHSWAIFNPPFIWFLPWNDCLRGSTGEVLAKYPLCAALCVGCRSIRRVMWELIVCGTGPMVTIGTLELDTGVSGIIRKVAA